MTGKLTKSQSKFVNSLKQKKYRDLNRRFVAEGIKVVEEALLSKIEIDYIIFTGDESALPFQISVSSYQTSEREMGQISSFKTPNRVMAICKIPEDSAPLNFEKPILALDGVSDPGNLGTIIRNCDWFGFDQLLCGEGTVDCFNPKVVQATMGSLFRVKISYQPLAEVLAEIPKAHPILYADMGGESIYDVTIPKAYTLVMGSESHGVSDSIRKMNAKSVAIPQYGQGESLNVAISAGIICAEFKRRS